MPLERHIPVLLDSTLQALGPPPNRVFLDVTFGQGGHSDALLDRGAKQVVGCDRDLNALDAYRSTGKYREDPRLVLVHCTLDEVPESLSPQGFDGVLADLGVSTVQLLGGNRGFSFNERDTPLDMRMDPTSDFTVKSYLATQNEHSLALDLERVTDLKNARRLARSIIQANRAGALQTTGQLADLAGPRFGKVHPATTLFLALRMLVNDEAGQVERGLPRLASRLAPGGRLAVISFHSSEDRLVKTAFRSLVQEDVSPFRLANKKPIEASREELRQNPRARSAKLRCIERLGQDPLQ